MDTLIRVQPINVVHHRGLRMGHANIYMPVHTAEICVLRTLRLLDILKVGVYQNGRLVIPNTFVKLVIITRAAHFWGNGV